jgi:maltose O-acetyltransferase
MATHPSPPTGLRWLSGRSSYHSRALLTHVHLRFTLANLISGLLPDFGSGVLRGRLYRLAGLDIAPHVFIMGNLNLVGGPAGGFYDKLHVGRGTVIGNHVTINVDAEVRMGTNVSLSPFVRIYTGTHQLGPGSNRRISKVVAKPVLIEDGCWIGLGAMLLPGVTLGHGSVVAAGAVVTEAVPADSYVEGNPAKVLRQLPWGDR